MSDPSATMMFAQQAIYHQPGLRQYRGNPFIEALPPLLSREKARALMQVLPDYQDEDRTMPATEREHAASLVSAIRQPTWLHGELYSRLSRLTCNGYLSRNPASWGFQRLVDIRVRLLESVMGAGDNSTAARTNGGYMLQPGLAPDANGLIFLGTSGIGKSKAIEMVLGLLPQLILHAEYAGHTFSTVQVPWIKLDVPNDGSVLSLAERFFIALDNQHLFAGLPSSFHRTYMTARTKEASVAANMARVSAQVGLGMLVLDEVQDLSSAKARKFLSFLVQLVNVVGVPVVLVGGLDAFHLVTEQFRQVRRGSTEGDLIVTQSEPGSRWNDFCQVLWNYQYTTEKVEMTLEHTEALFEVSQGITELLVIAYKNAQIRAISTNRPFVTPTIIRSVRDTLNLAQPALGALRRGSAFVIDRMLDLKVPAGVEAQPFLRADPPIASRPAVPAGKKAKTSGVEVVAASASVAAVGETQKAAGGEAFSKTATAAYPHESSHNATDVNMDRTLPAECDSPVAQHRALSAPTLTVINFERVPTLLQAVKDGMAQGDAPRASLISIGCGAGDLFRRIAQLPG